MLVAAMLPATALAAPNLGNQGTKTAPVTVHCWYDAANDLYDVLWSVSPDVLVRLAESEFSYGGFLLWSAASGKAAAPAAFIAEWSADLSVTYYSAFDLQAPDWPAGYVRVQAVNFGLFGIEVVASGVARCQRGDIGSPA
ncbi:MAG TPA: hypothetical protein VEX41_05535 [Candidatus Eisenbacteria bacterium]|nr:hypothetical protein [Candidatus Eisenbacteria bacterium]